MGTSGFMLIPVTPPTQCVAECAKCGFSGANEHSLGSIAQTGPQSEMTVKVTSERTHARNARVRIRAMHVIGLLHTEAVWHTSQSLHAIWCSPTCPHRDWGRDWLCDGGWPLVMGQCDIHIFLRRDQYFTHVRKQGICKHTNFTLEWFTNCICMSPSVAEICLQMSSVWGLCWEPEGC